MKTKLMLLRDFPWRQIAHLSLKDSIMSNMLKVAKITRIFKYENSDRFEDHQRISVLPVKTNGESSSPITS